MIELHVQEHIRAATVEFVDALPAPAKPALEAPQMKMLTRNKDGVYE